MGSPCFPLAPTLPIQAQPAPQSVLGPWTQRSTARNGMCPLECQSGTQENVNQLSSFPDSQMAP